MASKAVAGWSLPVFTSHAAYARTSRTHLLKARWGPASLRVLPSEVLGSQPCCWSSCWFSELPLALIWASVKHQGSAWNIIAQKKNVKTMKDTKMTHGRNLTEGAGVHISQEGAVLTETAFSCSGFLLKFVYSSVFQDKISIKHKYIGSCCLSAFWYASDLFFFSNNCTK